MSSDLAFQSISRLSPSIKSGELSSVELTGLMLQRIEQHNPRLKCYITVLADAALVAAEQADNELKNGRYRGPLHGIPIGIKDLVYTEAAPTGAGTVFLSDHLPRVDAPVLQQLTVAGAVNLGKLTLTDGAMSTHHPDLLTPVNPWDETRWTGDSSSGSGVAVAAGLGYGALGTDTLGSIRYPSFANNIVGLKPTFGRVNKTGVFPLADSLDHIGPMARTVGDVATMLAYMTDLQLYKFGLNDQVPLLGLATASPSLSGVKIGWDRRQLEAVACPSVIEAITALAERYHELGAEIVPVELPDYSDLLANWKVTSGVDAWNAHKSWFAEHKDDYTEVLRDMIEFGAQTPADLYAQLEGRRREFRFQLDTLLCEVDMLLCPVMPEPVPSWDKYNTALIDEGDSRDTMAYTAPFTFSGHPSLTLPGEWSDDGAMPIAHQLIGRSMGELDLLTVGLAYQQASTWEDVHPEL